jgi:hypothetical protein
MALAVGATFLRARERLSIAYYVNYRVRGIKRSGISRTDNEPVLKFMAGSLHTYNLDLTLIQNHITVVLSTKINALNYFNFSQAAAYEPQYFYSVRLARSSMTFHMMCTDDLDTTQYFRNLKMPK